MIAARGFDGLGALFILRATLPWLCYCPCPLPLSFPLPPASAIGPARASVPTRTPASVLAPGTALASETAWRRARASEGSVGNRAGEAAGGAVVRVACEGGGGRRGALVGRVHGFRAASWSWWSWQGSSSYVIDRAIAVLGASEAKVWVSPRLSYFGPGFLSFFLCNTSTFKLISRTALCEDLLMPPFSIFPYSLFLSSTFLRLCLLHFFREIPCCIWILYMSPK